jgi:hypothetical protein
MTDSPATSNTEITVTFQPQEWVDSAGQSHEAGRKQLIPAEDREPAIFHIPLEDGTDAEGDVYADKSYEANLLQSHPAAPDWVNGWDGAYYIRTALEDDANATPSI